MKKRQKRKNKKFPFIVGYFNDDGDKITLGKFFSIRRVVSLYEKLGQHYKGRRFINTKERAKIKRYNTKEGQTTIICFTTKLDNILN